LTNEKYYKNYLLKLYIYKFFYIQIKKIQFTEILNIKLFHNLIFIFIFFFFFFFFFLKFFFFYLFLKKFFLFFFFKIKIKKKKF